ncbi:hypothetical protein [Microbacterium paludicola]|uniref:hypothetical protein n=1 Tax=Microbacterium paludicola TaxID=300019 RepID=UPI0019FBE6D2|nr:hypothetical protein [Microbacterium paludicola]MBF0817272.1 hypothetical protein [Microbacterium paludicola]
MVNAQRAADEIEKGTWWPRTQRRIWADPTLTRNTHTIEGDADFRLDVADDREHLRDHRVVRSRPAAEASCVPLVVGS